MSKANKAFLKLSRKTSDGSFLGEDIKNMLSGASAGLASTTLLYPQDTVAAEKQVSGKQRMRNKSLSGKMKTKSFKAKNFGGKIKDISKYVGKKYYGGLGWKLTKTVPAAAVTFGAYPATKKLLDKIDPPDIKNMKKNAQQSYYVAKKKTTPKERFMSGVTSAGVPSAGLTGVWSGLAGSGWRTALKAAGGAGLVGTGIGYFLAPKERKILIPKN